MKPIARFLLAMIAVSLVLLLAAYISPAVAQDKPATIADLQTDTPCGAEAVGLNRSTGMPVRYQREGLHVGPDGVWTECTMPRAPAAKPLQAGCQLPTGIEWTSMDHECRASTPIELAHGASRMINSDAGTTTGGAMLSCRNGSVSVGFKYCSPATECEAGLNGATDDGGQTRWYFSGRVPMGGTVEATDRKNGKRKAVCEGGKLRLQ